MPKDPRWPSVPDERSRAGGDGGPPDEVEPEQLAVLIGERIVRLRGLRGYSQDRLSTETEISKSQLGRYERGESLPNAHGLRQLSRALAIDIDKLVADQDAILPPRGSRPRNQANPASLSDAEVALVEAFRALSPPRLQRHLLALVKVLTDRQ